MNADTLTTLYSHNLWANIKLFECCANLSDEQLDSTIIGTFGTIRDTLQHIVSAEQSYFARISTGLPRRRIEGAPAPTMAEMLESLRTTGAGFVEWAPKVQAGDLVDVKWENDETKHISKAIILTQVINHATEHRSQIMAILTQLGVQPPDLDGWTYFEENEQ